MLRPFPVHPIRPDDSILQSPLKLLPYLLRLLRIIRPWLIGQKNEWFPIEGVVRESF